MLTAPAFDATAWLMGLASLSLFAFGAAVWRSNTRTVEKIEAQQKESAKEVTTALTDFGKKFDRLEHTVFGVQGDNGHHRTLELHTAKHHRVANCLNAIALELGLHFDDKGNATVSEHPPMLERRLGLPDRRPAPRERRERPTRKGNRAAGGET